MYGRVACLWLQILWAVAYGAGLPALRRAAGAVGQGGRMDGVLRAAVVVAHRSLGWLIPPGNDWRRSRGLERHVGRYRMFLALGAVVSKILVNKHRNASRVICAPGRLIIDCPTTAVVYHHYSCLYPASYAYRASAR